MAKLVPAIGDTISKQLDIEGRGHDDGESSGTAARSSELRTDSAAVAGDVAAVDSPVEPSESGPAQRSSVLIALIIGVVLTIAVGVCGVLAVLTVRENVAHDDRDAAILDTSRQVVVNLVTLRHDTADADVARVADSTTGAFHDQFAGSSGSFAQVLQQGQVESTGEAKEVALVSSDDDHATVLAAVTSTVKNTEAPDGQSRVYRMKVKLDHIDGKWLVSDVEFVS